MFGTFLFKFVETVSSKISNDSSMERGWKNTSSCWLQPIWKILVPKDRDAHQKNILKPPPTWRFIPVTKYLITPPFISHRMAIWKGSYNPRLGDLPPPRVGKLFSGGLLNITKTPSSVPINDGVSTYLPGMASWDVTCSGGIPLDVA